MSSTNNDDAKEPNKDQWVGKLIQDVKIAALEEEIASIRNLNKWTEYNLRLANEHRKDQQKLIKLLEERLSGS